MATIGIDAGTSGTKVLLLDAAGDVKATATVEYDVQSPHPMWSEQDPDVWWQALCKGVRQVVRQAGAGGIEAVSFSGQMVGLVVLDEQGRLIRPCILWNDQRSAAITERLTEHIGLPAVLAETSNPLFANFVAPKLVWMRENEPDNYARIRHVVLPKDYLVYRLTGRIVTDVSDASGTCLFNVRERRWSEGMVEAMEIPLEWLPECVESEDVVGSVTAQAAADCGLDAGTVVVAGGGDQPVQAVGSGIVRSGRCSVTIGTSGVIFAQGERHLEHPEGLLHSFCHSVRGQWYLMGVMLSAGAGLQWLRNTIRALKPLDYGELCALAQEVPAGSEGLLFIPYLTGERCPHNDPYARGGWIGLTQRCHLPHLVRSVIEGITFGLNDSLNLMRKMGMAIDAVYASGGAVRSALWRQILADVFRVPVITTNATEGGAFGAALLAAVGAGRFKNVQEASDRWLQETGRTEPQPGVDYREAYHVYRGLYPALKNSFKQAASLETGKTGTGGL